LLVKKDRYFLRYESDSCSVTHFRSHVIARLGSEARRLDKVAKVFAVELTTSRGVVLHLQD